MHYPSYAKAYRLLTAIRDVINGAHKLQQSEPTRKDTEGLILVTSGLELRVVVDNFVSFSLEGFVVIGSVRRPTAGDKLFCATTAKQ